MMVAVRRFAAKMEIDAVVGCIGEDEVGAFGRKKNHRWRHR